MKKDYKFNFSPKTTPFSHQLDAINYVTTHNCVALFDEQGLGKTKIVIDSLCNNLQEGIIDGAIIICKKSLINTWKEEIETHSFLHSITLRGTENEKGQNFMGFAHFYLINYESVIREVTRMQMFMEIREMALVLDESHKIKDPFSKTTISIFQLKDFAKKRIIVSGTPIANKPIDIWSQFYFLDDGKLLGDNFKIFQKQYGVENIIGNEFENETKFDSLREIIQNNSIRRLKDDVLQLPGKIYIDECITISGHQKELYDQLRDELFVEITKITGEIIIDESDEILKRLLRLAQIASNPYLIDKAFLDTPSKFLKLDELIHTIIAKKEKVIVWTCFVENIRILAKRYKEFGSVMLYGEIPIEKRTYIVKQFLKDENCRVLLANPSAAKEGLTLTSANNAIYLDRNFNLVDYLQSQDRIHRISQTKECKIYKLIAKDTIDEYVDEIISKKSELANFVQGDTKTIISRKTITKNDLLKFLGRKSNE